MTEPPRAPKQGRLKAALLPVVLGIAAFRRALGVQVVYRSAGGGLIAGGLAYAALFALNPRSWRHARGRRQR